MTDNNKSLTKAEESVQKNAEAQQEKAKETNKKIEKATTEKKSTLQKVEGFLNKKVDSIEKSVQKAAKVVGQKYEDLTWHSDDWKKDLEIRVQKWKDSVEERIKTAGADSRQQFDDFKEALDKEYDELKGKGDHEKNEFTYRKWKAQLKKNYSSMMDAAEAELLDWTNEAKKRYSHSRSRVSAQDREEFDSKYRQWRKDMSDFTEAAHKRAYDYYQKCREYIKEKGVDMQHDEEVTKVRQRGEHTLKQHQQKWANAIDEIKEGLQEAKKEQEQEESEQGQQVQQSA